MDATVDVAVLVFWKWPPWEVIEGEGPASVPDVEAAHSEGNHHEL